MVEVTDEDRALLSEIYGGTFLYKPKREREILALIAAHRIAAEARERERGAVDRAELAAYSKCLDSGLKSEALLISHIRKLEVEIARAEVPVLSAKLPCDVAVPPGTVIRKGCTVKTLMLALALEGRPEHFAGQPQREVASYEAGVKDGVASVVRLLESYAKSTNSILITQLVKQIRADQAKGAV